MKNYNIVLIPIIALMMSACSNDTAVQTCTGRELMTAATGQPTVLVIGDSISIGYTPTMQTALGGTYDVAHNPCNAMDSRWTAQHIDKWLAERPTFEAVTWNNGLWDCADWAPTSDAEYEQNLHYIAQRLKAKTPKILFVLTTEVLPGTPHRTDACVQGKNAIAINVMAQEGIPVLDLHAFSQTIVAEHTNPTDVHFTPAGSALLGNEVLNELNNQYGIN